MARICCSIQKIFDCPILKNSAIFPSGKEEDVLKITPKDVEKFIKTYITKQNLSSVSIAGNITAREAEKFVYKYLILPFNHVFMFNFKGRITRLQYIISLLFSIFAPLLLMIISYAAIQVLKYIYSFLFNMPFDNIFDSFYLFGIVLFFYILTVSLSSIFLIILRINDIIKSKIIKVIMYIVAIFFITYLMADFKHNTIYFLIIIAIPVLFKSRNIEDNNLTAKGSE